MSGARIDAAEIAAMLGGRIDALAPELLPAGHIEQRRYWRVGSVAGEPGNSLVVYLLGAKRGRWRDYAAGEGGDALDLVAQTQFSGDMKRAIAWARNWLGIEAAGAEKVARWREEARAREVLRASEAAHESEEASGIALRLYLAARVLEVGDPVWRYLRGRGIDLAALDRPVRALRFHEGLWNRESGKHWPAMVAAITDAHGHHVATHRTWLTPQGDRYVKAPLEDAKMTLGAYAGGCVRLWRGATGKPLGTCRDEIDTIVAEGIEDALSAAIIAREHRVLAAVSLSAMGSMWLPAGVPGVIIAAQNDPAGSAAERGLARAVAHFRALGKSVRLLRPPVFVKDINELLQREDTED
jgi:hypothetical protein